MTNQHPLTDEICKRIVEDNVYSHPDSPLLDLTGKTCMRASYDMGQKDGIEQVIAWLKDNLQSRYLTPDGYSGFKIDADEVVSDLEEAMCPQQQETTDDTPTD
ncbi:MAG: hypothetical protein GY880_26150 [Planctomycetaceae bacterium]|nr:hypothetical protein [Planctomycetaceae bacterium]